MSNSRIFNNEKITNIFWILLRGLYGKHKHLSCGVILLWKFAFFAPFFDLDQIFATLMANVADMDGDGDLMGYLRRALMKMISLRGVQLEN